jgi:hypothetical protein
MPVPFHAALRDDLRPRGANGERALLEQRARLALADERWQRRRHGGDSTRRSRSGAERNGAPLRVACAIVLLALGLGAMASNAWAMPGSWPQVTMAGSGEVRSGGGQVDPTAVSPASGHHYTGHQLGQRVAIPTSAIAPPSSAKNASPGSAFHYTGRQFRRRAAYQPSVFSNRPSATFDWADASVGAGVTAVLGLIGAAGALRLSRRRVHGHMTA